MLIDPLTKRGSNQGYGLNNEPVVVGSSGANRNGRHAYLYQVQEDKVVDLNDLTGAKNVVLRTAFENNNSGQIICLGFQDGGGPWRAYLLTPVP